MRSQPGTEVKFEIGHVLFIDIVGYSKLLINEQREQIQKLREIVRATEQFRAAEAEGKLLRLPTGDGGALVFRTSPEAPVLCALEISQALKNHPELRVRMGIHSGPVSEVTDLNEQANIAGAGINIAQRVMDCADAGHILLSKRVAGDLEHYARWRPYLHELGECEVKHGAAVSLVNLYTDEVGNPQPPQKCRERAPEQKGIESPRRSLAKSIAVLPFQNLSEDRANAYFADGIQEEVLARLSKIADLKVISRTSTQRFKNSVEDLPQIAKQLGVANILEGSVQKAADQVRVHVQLIDAENDSHLWAEQYDRKLTDIFAVESDIAGKIADALQARLTGAERRAIASRPTENTEAHQLYLQGRYHWIRFFAPGHEKSRDYYLQAIELDPSYALAYIGLGGYYAFGAANGLLSPNENWPKAEELLNKALALDDTLAEAYHLLAAIKLEYNRDWPAAERAFHRSAELDPNAADTPHHYSFCLALFGRNQEALAQMERAAELDPFSPGLNLNRGKVLFFLRDYDQAIDQFKKTLELHPGYAAAHERLGDVYEKKGMASEAIIEWSKALTFSGESEDALVLQDTYRKSGFGAAVRALAQKKLERLNQKAAGGEYVPAMEFLMAHMRAGDREQAFAWLAKTVEERNVFAFETKINPILDSLRTDPRFEAIVQRLGDFS
jgi:adenylate cyclase